MCCQSFWKTLLPFFIALLVGVFIATALQGNRNAKSISEPIYFEGNGRAGGSKNELNCFACKDGHIHKNNDEAQQKTESSEVNSVTTQLMITSKPKPSYTDTAKGNHIQGTVNLRVQFLANGTIGSIAPITALPDGLTEKAIESARQIRFTPATKNGKAVTVTKTLQYTFTIY